MDSNNYIRTPESNPLRAQWTSMMASNKLAHVKLSLLQILKTLNSQQLLYILDRISYMVDIDQNSDMSSKAWNQ